MYLVLIEQLLDFGSAWANKHLVKYWSACKGDLVYEYFFVLTYFHFAFFWGGPANFLDYRFVVKLLHLDKSRMCPTLLKMDKISQYSSKSLELQDDDTKWIEEAN